MDQALLRFEERQRVEARIKAVRENIWTEFKTLVRQNGDLNGALEIFREHPDCIENTKLFNFLLHQTGQKGDGQCIPFSYLSSLDSIRPFLTYAILFQMLTVEDVPIEWSQTALECYSMETDKTTRAETKLPIVFVAITYAKPQTELFQWIDALARNTNAFEFFTQRNDGRSILDFIRSQDRFVEAPLDEDMHLEEMERELEEYYKSLSPYERQGPPRYFSMTRLTVLRLRLTLHLDEIMNCEF